MQEQKTDMRTAAYACALKQFSNAILASGTHQYFNGGSINKN